MSGVMSGKLENSVDATRGQPLAARVLARKDELEAEECFHTFTNLFVEVLPAIEHRGQSTNDHCRLVGLTDCSDDVQELAES